MRTKGHILLVVAMICGKQMTGQHTPLTSQYLFNGLVINPAYAGSRDALAANLTYRHQWAGLDGAPVTQIASIHAPVARRKVGLGLLLYNDKIGVSQETGLFSNYAYRVRFRNGKLSFGLGAGLTFLRSQWSTLAIQQTSDISFASDTRSAIRPNFSTGAFYYTKNWFVGVSAPFLIVHRYSVNNDGWKLSDSRGDLQPMLTGGYVFELSREVKLKPSTLVRYRTATGVQADLSTNLIYQDRIWLGASYRSGDAFVASLEVLPTPQWRLGYAYDLGMSKLRAAHFGSHEVMLQYEFGYRIRVKDPRSF
ncbi:MAG: type IX secretion system membrane protein PorP/SprF [Flavobacteriales bacterium]|jgi:type IX secretion system PorP/SprF family membrane protein|nr:type IX secretion system membrane protein PorP/SprF [Flavobacteriales bacterium]MBK6550938.1 type IX secretion system membrane protein PorP/SprF [Flavobacteriales bacterium]MBK6882495.1 type IX secretion system membrane protein PorP/SprF [Flavobacteriales bacterium]MBK7101290.1 type IX secretion system membrane protein PorP/SprF [Flavobacteriales bacterium]MBK7111997.1 type IX secretion system membrane protein PorP/SprF [Flavobacteriales bacterium]